MDRKEVAIIIPTLNEEKFIAGCLHSVLSQTYPAESMDIMVVDGGSSDKTVEIVRQFSKTFPNIRLIRNPKRIQSVAFNLGVKESDAPYIVRLDAHAVYDKDYIQLCISHLKANADYGNVGGVWDIQPQNESLQAQANAIANQVRFGIGGASFRVGAEAGEVDTVPFGAFSRTVLNNVGLMREDLPRGEDNEINARIRRNGYKIFLDPRIVSTYYARPTIGESAKQMYNNGLSIGWLMHIDPHSIGLRHLIPSAFLLSLIVSLVLASVVPGLWVLFVGILGMYLLAAVIASCLACKKFGFKYLAILPVLFFCMHIAYGWGTLVGLFHKK